MGFSQMLLALLPLLLLLLHAAAGAAVPCASTDGAAWQLSTSTLFLFAFCPPQVAAIAAEPPAAGQRLSIVAQITAPLPSSSPSDVVLSVEEEEEEESGVNGTSAVLYINRFAGNRWLPPLAAGAFPAKIGGAAPIPTLAVALGAAGSVVAMDNGTLLCLDTESVVEGRHQARDAASNGTASIEQVVRWRADAPRAVRALWRVGNGTVAVTAEEEVLLLDVWTGDVVGVLAEAVFHAGAAVRPVVGGDGVFGFGERTVTRFDVGVGEVWRRATGIHIDAVAVGASAVYVAGAKGRVKAMLADDGVLLFDTATGQSVRALAVDEDADVLVVLGETDVSVLAARDGTLQFHFAVDTDVDAVHLFHGLLFLDPASEGISVVCGDGIVGPGEACDDGNGSPGDGCSATCQPERGFACDGGSCVNTCGDGLVTNTTGELCDDGNRVGGDGCSADCDLELGFVPCNSNATLVCLCGNGRRDANETCDDGNRVSGDGCSAACTREPLHLCQVDAALGRDVCVPGCAAGDVAGGCADGNLLAGDGCSEQCLVEPGFVCGAAGCVPTCGNGQVDAGEACDDGNVDEGDGCSSTCVVEPGRVCTDEEPSICGHSLYFSYQRWYIVVLTLAIGLPPTVAIVRLRLWTLLISVLLSVADLVSDLLFATTALFVDVGVLGFALVVLLATNVVGLCFAVRKRSARPPVAALQLIAWTRPHGHFVKAILVFIGVLLTIPADILWLLLGLVLFSTKVLSIKQVSDFWARGTLQWVPRFVPGLRARLEKARQAAEADASPAPKASDVEQRFADRGLSVMTLHIQALSELILETVPMLLIVVVNNIRISNLGGDPWDDVSVVSIAFSGFTFVANVWHYAYQKFVRGHALRDIPPDWIRASWKCHDCLHPEDDGDADVEAGGEPDDAHDAGMSAAASLADSQELRDVHDAERRMSAAASLADSQELRDVHDAERRMSAAASLADSQELPKPDAGSPKPTLESATPARRQQLPPLQTQV